MITKTSSIPIYLQIAQSILDKIVNGEYTVNSKIPTEEEIVNQFGVSRMTARHAVTYLVNEGLVYRVHGKGAFVSATKLERNLNKLRNFTEDIQSLDMNPSSKLVEFSRRVPTQREQHLLKIKKNQDVFYVRRIRYVNDQPLGVQSFVVPVHIVPNMEQIDLEQHSFYTYLEDIGLPPYKADQRMESVLAPKIAREIGISEKNPFFYFERISYTENEVPLEILSSYFRGDMYSYSISLFR